MPSDNPSRRIAVALSGGVDSAVVAALLKAQGHEVIALTMLLQKHDTPTDAQRVAQALEIPLHILDLTERFAACVMEPFADSYLRGETPLPCALCNRHLKFGDVMREAQKRGAQVLATGHYARRVETPTGAQLHAGADLGRDQSYFLFALNQAQLDALRFPLGESTKAETRILAAQYGLPVAEKPDSQDICFVPGGDYVAVLEQRRPGAAQPGEILDLEGHVLGTHEGIIHFTVGQRRGLRLGTRSGDHNEPLFVLRLDALKRQVIVGPREALAAQTVFLKDINWLAPELLEESRAPQGLAVTVRLRSTQRPVAARFIADLGQAGTGRIELVEPVLGVSAGQAGVIYKETRLLGGGWITGGC